MSNFKLYTCEICKTKPDQISHHKSHLKTQKHNDKKELFKLKLEKLSKDELLSEHNENDIEEIIKNKETKASESIKKLKEKEEFDNIKKELHLIMDNHIISNREALKDKIHEIHNFLRNNGAGYGMNALKVFNVLYGLKKIEENNLSDKVGLSKKCKFSYLLKLVNEEKTKELSNLIYNDVLDSLHENKKMRKLLFHEIPKDIESVTFSYLIKEINNIQKIEEKCNILLSGKVYEYFIGRDESAISELGAYFTDRHITDYIYNILNLKLNKDNSIKSMCDMFGGSGGFTTGYINYLNKNNKNKINWETEINKIYHYDMNSDVIKSAALEIFCLTNEIPNMSKNVNHKNSFNDEFDDEKYDLIITNPPYGGDKTKKTDSQIKREKVIEYIKKLLKDDIKESKKEKLIKQLKNLEKLTKYEKNNLEKQKVNLMTSSMRIKKFAKKYGLKGNDKEACSLMLMMDMLEENGICAGVLKEGVFFNRVYGNLRKCLINNFNVKKVISVPQDQFENTSTKTSIIIFENTKEKTTEVEFYELVIERFEEDKFEFINDNIELIENKGDIKCVNDKLLSVATLEELNENKIYSLNGKDYNKRQIKCGKDYELKKLGDICNFKKYKNQEIDINGVDNYYTCSNYIKKCSNGNINGEYILIGTRGTINDAIHYHNGRFGCSNNMLVFNSIKINNKYIYYVLLSLKKQINNFTTGSTIPMLSLENFEKILIPIPKSQEKINEWVNKISKQYDRINSKKTKVNELETKIKNKIKQICENEECEEIKFDKLFKYCTKKNKYLASDGKTDGKYRFYTSSQDRILYRDDFDFSDTCILIGRGGVSSLHIANKFSVSHDDVYVLKLFDEKYNIKYLYYFIKIYKNLLDESFKGSTIKHCSKTTLSTINIKIPKNKKLITIMDPLFNEIEELQSDIKKAEEKYNKLIQDLSDEAIPKEKTINKIENNNKQDENDNKSNKKSSDDKVIEKSKKNDDEDDIIEIEKIFKNKSKEKKSKKNLISK